MSYDWVRLWVEMPNDPKFKTVARISEQPISLVIATYVHLMVDASQSVTNVTNVTNVTRGHVSVTIEDLASALDTENSAITSILNAMEGRLIKDRFLTGWDKRQPKREDSGGPEGGAKSSAQRQRELRARNKAKNEDSSKKSDVTKCHAPSRNVTTDKTRLDKKNTNKVTSENFEKFWSLFDVSFGAKGSKAKALSQWNKISQDEITIRRLTDAASSQLLEKMELRSRGEFCPQFQHVERWLKNERWNDEIGDGAMVDSEEMIF